MEFFRCIREVGVRTDGMGNWYAFLYRGSGRCHRGFPLPRHCPLVFRGEIEYGVVSQSAMAFHRVRSALNIIVDNFSVISSIRATTLRLKNLLEDLEQHERRHSFVLSSALCSERKYALQVKNLTLCTPVPASTLLCKSLSFQVPLGTNLLVSGSTGCGKSSLLRCFANLWKPKEGSVLFGCNTKHVAFVPQTPYMPIGTLRGPSYIQMVKTWTRWSFVGQNVTSCTGTCVSASSRRAGRWS